MTSAPPTQRTQADRCPGLLRPHQAADGALVRLRLPGGRIAAAALRAVSTAAVDLGDGHVQLTSRGNLQLRGVWADEDGEAPAALVDAIIKAGLVPSATHELVRNITCSPLTGRIGGLADLRETVVHLDDMLCSTAALASLPGRFLFGLDDGRGDVHPLQHDLGLFAVGPEDVALTIAGRPGPAVALRDAVPMLGALALGFLRARGSGSTAAWHVAELPDGGAGLLDDLASDAAAASFVENSDTGPAPAPGLGVLRQGDGRDLLSFDVPLGSLTPAQIDLITATATGVGSGELIITPWRTMLIPDLTATPGQLAHLITELDGVALSTDQNSGWHGISACTGAPGCAGAAAPTRPIAEMLAAAGPAGSRPVHVIACERRCGSPAGDHVEVLAIGGSRHLVSRRGVRAGAASPSGPTTTSDLPRAVALARTAP